MTNLVTAKRDAANWEKFMMRARESPNKLALENVETTLPQVSGALMDVMAEDLAFTQRITRVWNGALYESIIIANLNLALTSIQDSKRKMEAAYESLTAKTKARKELFTGQNRSLSGLAKEKTTAERAFKAAMVEQQLKITELDEKLDLVSKDIDLATVNSEAAEIITLEQKEETLIQSKLAIELAVRNSEDIHLVNMARYQVTARRSERISSNRKTNYCRSSSVIPQRCRGGM